MGRRTTLLERQPRKRFGELLKEEKLVACDIETSSLSPFDGEIESFQFAFETGESFLLRSLFDEERALLEKTDRLVFHNAQFDLMFLIQEGFSPKGRLWDTMLAEQVLSFGRRRYISLKELVKDYLDFDLPEGNSVKHAEVLIPIYKAQREKAGTLFSVIELENDCILPLTNLRLRGIKIDLDLLSELLKETKEELKQKEKLLLGILSPVRQLSFFGEEKSALNLRSPQQLGKALARVGILVKSTSQDSLRSLLFETKEKRKREILESLLEFKRLQKLVSNYGDALLRFVEPTTQRIHPEVFQLGARSARIIFSRPNLQTLPRIGKFRNCVIADEGFVLVWGDYEQQELRILAELSRDRNLRKALENDIHQFVAEKFGVSRQIGKSLNFGLIYGMTAKGLALRTGIKEQEAETFIEAYFRLFPLVRDYFTRIYSVAEFKGFVATLAGRRIAIDSSENLNRLSRNLPIQGTGADMLKSAIKKLWPRLPRDAYLILPLHDELLIECREEDEEKVKRILKTSMIEAGKEFLSFVPVKVSIKSGKRWS